MSASWWSTAIAPGWWSEVVTARLSSDEHPDEVHELMILNTWFERMRGLLATSPNASPVMLTRCRSIHTFGMGYPIDVAFVGELGEVIEVRRALAPGVFASNRDACCVVERPAQEGSWLEEGEHLWVVAICASSAGA